MDPRTKEEGWGKHENQNEVLLVVLVGLGKQVPVEGSTSVAPLWVSCVIFNALMFRKLGGV